MNKVFDQYVTHLQRLYKKKPSESVNKGIAYYTAAAETLEALINAPTPAWVGLKFEHPLRTR